MILEIAIVNYHGFQLKYPSFSISSKNYKSLAKYIWGYKSHELLCVPFLIWYYFLGAFAAFINLFMC